MRPHDSRHGLCSFDTGNLPVRKFFLVKEQIVKLFVDLELISICEHHERHNTTSCIYVTNYFQLFLCEHTVTTYKTRQIYQESNIRKTMSGMKRYITSKNHAIAISLHSDHCHTQYGNQYGMSMATDSLLRYIVTQRCYLASGFLDYRRHDNLRINVSPYTEKLIERMSQQSDSLFQLRDQIEIRPIFRQWHYPALVNQSNSTPTSRKDYCKSLALCHCLVETSRF